VSYAGRAYRAVERGVNTLLRPLGVSLKRNSTHSIETFYPPSYRPEPRWEDQPDGHQPQLKKLLESGEARYLEWFDRILARAGELAAVARDADPNDPRAPNWVNGWFPALDAAALHTVLAETRPPRYLEVGSGNSTKFARRAIALHGLATTITSIDPAPRAEIDALCDQVIRQPMEAVPLSTFESLAPGDVLFVDGSHRSFMNSDVTILFLDVLPRLKRGVLVQVHDIYLPADYIRRIGTNHLYNEQYLLAAYLLGGARNVEVLLPNYWLTTIPRHAERRAELWKRLGFAADFPADHLGGGSFWMRVTRDPE